MMLCSRPERVAEIAEKRFGLDPSAVLDNVLIARCLTHEHQHEMLAAVAAKIAEDDEPYRMLIVDSVMGLFRVEFSGRGELAERQQKLGAHIHELVKARFCELARVRTRVREAVRRPLPRTTWPSRVCNLQLSGRVHCRLPKNLTLP
ncbi:MAG: hypothetical protein EOO65_01205 [Methanosarcinales archaeon]|nr:MAG: hypothetical protein EOO65_01205 [Methanosarcinales archaeon]